MTPPQGMSAEQWLLERLFAKGRLIGVAREGDTGKNYSIEELTTSGLKLLTDALADERVKAWNEAIEAAAGKHCDLCGEKRLTVWYAPRKSLMHVGKTGGLDPCLAKHISGLKLPEAQPVECTKEEKV